jgi:rod shape-determining protein MreC
MGVVSSKGIAGIIVGVSKHFALGMSMLHKDARISGRIKKNNQLVNITWEGNDYSHGKVNDIPKHIDLIEGDTIITSGNSLLFPEGILIGTIEEFQIKENELFNSAVLSFETDFNSLYYIYIIENQNKEEILNLESNINN